MGIILACSYVHHMDTEFRFIYDPVLLSCLETLGSLNTIEEDTQESMDMADPEQITQLIIVKDELCIILQAIVAYTRQKIFTDETLCTVEDFVRGIRDVFSKIMVATTNRTFVEYIQRYIWYWFEQRLSVTTYNGPRARIYFFKVV